MDTTNNAPVEAAGATAAPETATSVDTQPVETANTSAGEATNTGEASLLAGKYKSPQELEKAYKELEGKIGSLGQKAKIADVIQQKYGVSAEQLQARIEAQEQEAKRQLYADNPLAPVIDEVSQLRQKVEQQEQEKALMNETKERDEFLSKNPEYQTHKDQLLKLALTPGIGFDPETGDSVSYEELANQWFGQARAQGQQDAYQKIETKKQGQTTSASTTQPAKGGYSSLKDLPLKERIKTFEGMMGV